MAKLSLKSLINMYGGAKIKSIRVPKLRTKKVSLRRIKAPKIK